MSKTSKVQVGVILGHRMKQTIIVAVERKALDATFKKYRKKIKKYKVHDERSEGKQGDRVEIMEIHPISREKRWSLKRVIERAEVVDEAVT